MKKKDWFKLKRYPHIGLPIKAQDRPWVTQYVSNPEKISKHAFFPFVHRKTEVRKFRRLRHKDGTRSKLRVKDTKVRELYYSNHLDSMVYSYYAMLLNGFYETKLKDLGLSDSVTAYRRIKINPEDELSIHKSSVDFAAEVFNYILNSADNDLVVITFDIKGFFDNLNHKRLKTAWYEVQNKKTLESDSYNVFRNITNYSYVNEKQLFNQLKGEIIVESKSGARKTKVVKRIHHLKNQGAIAYCETKDFDEKVRKQNLIVGNHKSDKFESRAKGIPQGSPISAVLANVYMLNFDLLITEAASKMGALYRRYSDDMIIVCNRKFEGEVIKLFHDSISERELEIQDNKTQVFYFSRTGDKFTCTQNINNVISSGKNLEYLGFEFDGQHTFLKSASLASFYRKMKRAHNRCLFYSKVSKSTKIKDPIFKTRLYKKYSYKGKGRRRIFKQDPKDASKWVKTESHNWGNYLSYADLAINKLPNNKIKGQIKRHWNILNQLIN